ncbi:MAG: response regulator [Candidatus Obscuribacterales bacterium]|nr:response regulator [Candidatus Obscuribacterales bacterium]
MTRVLLAEDDEYLLSALALALKHKGYIVDTVANGSEVQTAMIAASYDLLLLDLGLPGLDGTEVIRRIRNCGDEIPIIIITARDTVKDKIAGLDLGANDYLVKPFDVGELEARIRAVLRKGHWKNKIEIEFASLKLNTNSGDVYIEDKQISLTPKEAVVLKMLMAAAGQVVVKQALIDKLARWSDEPSENAVEILVHRLRKKLEVGGVGIKTVRGFGYCLEESR